MATVGRTETSDIAVHWKEEEYIQPPASFVGQANLTDPAVTARFSEERFPECFREYADMLDWDRYWHTTLDTSHPPFWKWFAGGRLNACYNCVDRHLDAYKNKAALIFVPESEAEPAHTLNLSGTLHAGERSGSGAARLLWAARRRPRDDSHAHESWSCRSRCSHARGWASSTPWFSADSVARRLGCEPPTLEVA